MADTSRPAVESRADADSSFDSDLSGREMGGYRLLRRLGRGAMAEVYLAEQISLGRQVAFKVLRRSLASDVTYVERFLFEARAAAQLVHANIVQIFEVGCVDGVHFIAQEYVQGMNLAELLGRRAPPDTRRMLAISRQVAAALHRAAERGIVHRDIKPENIMLAANGEVKVADFGLARLSSRADDTSLTQVGITMGTPLYMSPEQVEGKALDSRSDIYSLGVTCYEMLAGEPPFRGDTALAIAVQHLQVPPQRLENIRPDLPSSVCRIVHKMLAKDPRERYASPRELLRELRAVSIELYEDDPGAEFEGWGEDEVPSTVEARRQATLRLSAAMKTMALPAQHRRSRWWWAALAAGCFVVGVAAAWTAGERPLIVPAAEQQQAVPQQGTAEAQYYYAMLLGSEAGWKSVSDYFPQDRTFSRRAKQNLALHYLEKLDYARALALFNEFAAANDAEVQLRAFGLAGRAIVLHRQGKNADSAGSLAELYPIRDKLDHPEMRALVEMLLSSRQMPGDPQSLERWRQWLEQTSAPGRAGGSPGEPNGDARRPDAPPSRLF